MKKFIFILLIPVLFFLPVDSTMAEELVLEYNPDLAFTLEDDPPGTITLYDSDTSQWGQITYSIDEFHLLFDISNLDSACSAKFSFSLTSNPTVSLPLPYVLNIAVYESNGIASTDDFGKGDLFTSVIISNIEENVFVVDLTSIFNSFIDSGVSHLGIRLYDPISIDSPTGTAQLLFTEFDEANLIICPLSTSLGDTMHPTGAVHAHPNILWPPNNKRVVVKLTGYVLDELSITKDGGGIGVSRAFLNVDNRIIILKDDSTNLLDENGRFDINVKLLSRKHGAYQIRLYAADNSSENPNFGLVDSTIVRVPINMNGKQKDRCGEGSAG
jgi:hypothetical protein